MSEHHPPAFEAVVAGVIVANTALLLWPLLDDTHEVLIDHIETACLLFFAVELLIRIRNHGWSFFRRPWCVADTAIIMLSVLPVLGASVSLLRVGRLARLVHLSRHISGLRVFRLFLFTKLVMHARWRMAVGTDGPQLIITKAS